MSVDKGEAKLRSLGVGRRMPDDPLFTAGDTLCRTYLREGIIDIDDEQLCHQVVAAFPCEVPGCQESFSVLLDHDMHYNSCHRFICGQCRKSLPSAHFLDLHLSETHDSFFAAQAERKPMYRCFVEECPLVSQNESERRLHCIDVHKFPRDFRYDQSLKKSKKQTQGCLDMEMKNESDTMHVDATQENKTHTVKHFTFGHSKGRTFSKNNKSKVVKEKNSNKAEPLAENTASEMMDTYSA